MLFLNQKEISSAVPLPDMMDTIQAAMIASENPEELVLPLRTTLSDRKDNTLMLMPCLSKKAWGLKILTLFPENTKKGRPFIDGTMMLYAPKTGEPWAIMEGKTITSIRTGAVSGIGIRLLSQENAATLGLIGAGIQGYWQIRYACKARDIKDVWVYDICPERVPLFIERLRNVLPQVHFHAAKDSKEILENTEIIITATTSAQALFPEAPELLKGHCFIGIGSFRPDMREYPDALFDSIQEVYVDTLHAQDETGDLIAPVQSGILKKTNIHTMGSILKGTHTLTPHTTSFLKSVGERAF